MLRTLKILFIVLGLGIFILPKQLVFAQNTIECCEQESTESDCCNTETPMSCHPENSKDDCADDCSNCHSCTVHFVINFLSPETNDSANQQVFALQLNFDYGISYFSSTIQNIWQPPKIS